MCGSAFRCRAYFCASRIAARATQQTTINPAQQNGQLPAAHLHRLRAGRNGEWDPVRPAVETLVQQPIATTVVPEDLDVGTPPIVEDENGFTTRVFSELLSNDTGESVEGEMEVDRLGGDVDRSGQTHHRVESSAVMTARTRSSSGDEMLVRTRSTQPRVLSTSHAT